MTCVIAATGCTDVSAPHSARPGQLSVIPSFSLLGGSAGEPINRIRLTANDVATGRVVGELVSDVDPGAAEWSLNLEVSLTARTSVTVSAELMNLADGSEAVQWSGLSAPVVVAPKEAADPARIQLFQGPIPNLSVASVVVSPDSAVVRETGTTQFRAALAGPNGARAIWSTADTKIATVDQQGVIKPLRPGRTLIFAVAGPRADTAVLRVTPANTTVVDVSVVGGEGQTGTVTQEVRDSVRVRALDANGGGVSDVDITWTPEGGAPPFTSRTNAQGVAMARWRLGSRAGSQSMNACSGSVCAVVHGKARADKARKANKNTSSDNQDVIVNQIAPNALELTVLDNYDNPTRGTVEWSLSSSGPAGSLSANVTAIDTLTGKATITWRVPTTKGKYTVDYVVKDEDGKTIASGDFHANAKPDKPAKDKKRAGADGQTVVVAQTAPNALELTITDQYDNSIDGATVNWSLHAGHAGGSLSRPSSVTDTAGKASVSWQVGTKAGKLSVDYVVTRNDTTFASGHFDATAKPEVLAKVKAARKNETRDALADTSVLSGHGYDKYDNERDDSVTWVAGDGLATVSKNGTHVTKGNGNSKAIVRAGAFADTVLFAIAQRVKTLTIDERHDTIRALDFVKKAKHTQKDRKQQVISDAAFKSSVSWLSRDASVATFIGDSLISVGNGTAVIVAIATIDSSVLDSVAVLVQQAAATPVTFTPAKGSLLPLQSVKIGNKIEIEANAKDAAGKDITKWTWTAAPGSLVQLDHADTQKVTVKGVAAGTITLTARTPNGESASLTITISP